VDEMETNTSLSSLYAWFRKCERACCSVPRNRGKNTTLLESMNVEGWVRVWRCSAAPQPRSEAYVERVLVLSLRRRLIAT
jgi:hypothetical protein